MLIPWLDLYTYLYEYELLDEGMISQEVFDAGFESIFLHGEQIDVWALQKEYNQTKQGGFHTEAAQHI